MANNTPKHFGYAEFSDYILECAIRDRETFLACYDNGAYTCYDQDEDTVEIIRETRAEIRAMTARLSARLKRRGKS